MTIEILTNRNHADKCIRYFLVSPKGKSEGKTVPFGMAALAAVYAKVRRSSVGRAARHGANPV